MFSTINNIVAAVKKTVAQLSAAILSLKKLLKLMNMIGLDRLLRVIETVELSYGHHGSFLTKTPVNAAGEPLPWYTYPAIEYLSQLDFSGKAVFEYGCGNSSLFWAERAGTIRSVESNKEWFIRMKKDKRSNQEIHHIDKKDDYINSILLEDKKYDIIVIDGEFRLGCAQAAIDRLAPGGFIILDNSDWFPRTAHFLRTRDLIQVDFAGLGPVNYYTWTTSLFFRRDAALKARSEAQPEHAIGSKILTVDNE